MPKRPRLVFLLLTSWHYGSRPSSIKVSPDLRRRTPYLPILFSVSANDIIHLYLKVCTYTEVTDRFAPQPLSAAPNAVILSMDIIIDNPDPNGLTGDNIGDEHHLIEVGTSRTFDLSFLTEMDGVNHPGCRGNNQALIALTFPADKVTLSWNKQESTSGTLLINKWLLMHQQLTQCNDPVRIGAGSTNVTVKAIVPSADFDDIVITAQTMPPPGGTPCNNPCEPTEIKLAAHWNGFLVPESWVHLYNQNENSIRTQLPNIILGDAAPVPEKIRGKRGGANGEHDYGTNKFSAKSAETSFSDGFTLELDYTFDPAPRTNSPPAPSNVFDNGYVPIEQTHPTQGIIYPHKLSFVANSGGKFGTDVNPNGVESAILDVEKMVEMAGVGMTDPIDAFQWDSNTKGIQADGMIRGMSNPGITVDKDGNPTTFVAEHVTTLMSHVMYGADPSKTSDYTMKDFNDAVATVRAASSTQLPSEFDQFPDDKKHDVWWYTLKFNLERRSTKMRLTVAPATKNGKSGFNVTIERWSNLITGYEVSCAYHTSDFRDVTPIITQEIRRRLYFESIGLVYLQTHWHSGVKFTNAILNKN